MGWWLWVGLALAGTYYADDDGDGYGDAEDSVEASSAPSGYVSDDSDCNDDDSDVNPAATETCDGTDEDCDDDVDEGAGCPCDMEQEGDHAYLFCEYTTVIWANAQRMCETYGYNLATISDETENDWIDAEADSRSTNKWWVGLNDVDTEGTYVWADGSDFIFEAWASGEPNNSGTNEDCLQLNRYSNAEWNDEPCDLGFRWICESGIPQTLYLDADGDGFGDSAATDTIYSSDMPSGYADNADDCDDSDSGINPDADETCDEVDEDCDGTIDEDATDEDTFYADADGDGFGDADDTTTSCDLPSGYSEDDDDCDDADADINPDADETCDEVDEDCDGSIDEDPTDPDTFYADADGDGYGDSTSTYDSCELPSGYTTDDSDCDDGDSGIYPGAEETCDDVDEDCDSIVDEDATDSTTYYRDKDGDGYGKDSITQDACEAPSNYVAIGGDCKDSDSSRYPGAPEECDGDDDDCDDITDEDAIDASTWYVDDDGDSFGDAGDTSEGCDQPSGTVSDDSDCDDSDASIYPGAEETCDSVDEDCDSTIDEDATDEDTYYADDDGDGFGDADDATASCEQPSSTVEDDSDCDDGDSSIYPGADETCDEVDEDCDGSVDEDAIDETTYYRDKDGDGYGKDSITQDACEAPSNYVDIGGDCKDSDATRYPGAPEECDGDDDDCDDVTDEDAIDADTFYADADGDGYGDPDAATAACDQPSGTVEDDSDCDDDDELTYPGADETCDDDDDDCDEVIDEDAIDAGTYYADLDSDGFGDPFVSYLTCDPPSYAVLDSTDCDDLASGVNPDALETCDGVDEDCDERIDEDAIDVLTWWQDADGDGFGNPEVFVQGCEPPEGFVGNDEDCDDTNPDINPDADDLPNGIDDDCDGEIDVLDTAVPQETGGETGLAETGGDTAPVVDSGDTAGLLPPDEYYYRGGCGCDAPGGGTVGWMWLLGLGLLRRRRA